MREFMYAPGVPERIGQMRNLFHCRFNFFVDFLALVKHYKVAWAK
ncbi:hypothetical protein [Aeromonas phage Riv-10]|nr:hypothetical protein [Aeromonas phage Riv-10]